MKFNSLIEILINSQYVPIKQIVKFDGENDVIQGTDNLLTGSLSIGNSIGTGIEGDGVNSVYSFSWICRIYKLNHYKVLVDLWYLVVQFQRFVSSYEGVGLKIHDGNSGSFKFRTHNEDGVGEFDVRTNKFFFGKSGSQFISGSDDKIEISSSKFHLKNDGNVVVNGKIKLLVVVNTSSLDEWLVAVFTSSYNESSSCSKFDRNRYVIKKTWWTNIGRLWWNIELRNSIIGSQTTQKFRH